MSNCCEDSRHITVQDGDVKLLSGSCHMTVHSVTPAGVVQHCAMSATAKTPPDALPPTSHNQNKTTAWRSHMRWSL